MNPLDNIIWVDPATLNANYWNPNRVHKPELKLLEFSLVETGWLQPLLVNRHDIIIDGFHRWMLSQQSDKVKALSATDGRAPGLVPVAVLDKADDEAMAITVRINRAKGAHVAVEMHRLVDALLTQHGWSRERVAKEIGATLREVDTLAQEGVFAARDIKNWAYSKAWYPIEAEERPPGPQDEPTVDEPS